MKIGAKFLVVSLVFMSLFLTSCNSTGCKTSSPSDTSSLASSDQPTSLSESQSQLADGEQTLGDFSFIIESVRLSKNFEDAPVAVVKFKWTNNSDEAASFSNSLYPEIYQDGKKLDLVPGQILMDEPYIDEYTTKIQPGISLEFEYPVLLLNTEDPITVEVSKYISLDHTKIKKELPIN